MGFIWWLTILMTLVATAVFESPVTGLIIGLLVYGMAKGLRWFIGSLREFG